jgi:hypothetical protein
VAAIAGAVVVGTIAVVWLPLLWVAIALVLLGVRWSRPDALETGADPRLGATAAVQEPT